MSGTGVTPEPGAAQPTPGRRARKVRRGPILFVVVAALVAAVVVQQSESSSSGSPGPAAAVVDGVSMPPAAALSATWFCAEGTSTPDGRATETVLIASMADTPIEATVTVMPGNATPVAKRIRVAPRAQVNVPIADILVTAEPGVTVEITGGRAVVSHQLVNGSDIAVEPCSRSAGPDWYFAAGTTVKGSTHYLALFNPFGDDAIVDVTFLTDTGVQQPDQLQAIDVPRRTRISVAVHEAVPRQELIATSVHARTGRIVAERTQIFDGTPPDSAADPTRQGIAVSLGAQSPSPTWRIVAGSTKNGGTAMLGIANFNSVNTSVEVSVILSGDQALPPQTVSVPARGVVAVDLTARVPADTDYAVTVTSRDAEGVTGPVVAEVLATWPEASSSTGVASTMGSPVAARRWILPLPHVDADATLTVLDPGRTPVTATLLPAPQVDRRTGPTSEPERAISPGRLAVFQIVHLDAQTDAMVVTADHPVVVGLTVLGNAGASTSAAIPDLAYAG
jgi:hypothetical protein